jgi:hypothetical protein
VPADAPPPPAAHPKLGKPSATWTYRDANGAVCFYVMRFDAKGEKQFRPLCFARPTIGAAPQWRWESPTGKRPLYGLDRLANQPAAPVVVTEGEKSADAATKLLPNHVAMTSPNGSKSAVRADWSPLAQRTVVIWPDADEPGSDYAKAVARFVRAAGATSVTVVVPPANVAMGWDAADALAEGWTTERASKFIEAAFVAESEKTTAESQRTRTMSGSGRVKPTDDSAAPAQRDILLRLTEFVELWHNPRREGFVTLPLNGHRENWSVRSHSFELWLRGRYYEETKRAINSNSLEDILCILEVRAINEGPKHETFVRVGRSAEKFYLDLVDDRWRAVEVDSAGWRVIDSAPVKFLRFPTMRDLPEPIQGGMIEELRPFLNLRDNDEFILVASWLAAALSPLRQYPIIAVDGERGSGKTVFASLLRLLVDPADPIHRGLPSDERNLFVGASNEHVIFYDNLSRLSQWVSDSLCRLSLGAGFASRKLNTDSEEFVFSGSRPILFTGIPELADRADLASRTLSFHLHSLGKKQATERAYWRKFIECRPSILGALLDAVSTAIRNLPSIEIEPERFPRLADFAEFAVAASGGFGWTGDDVLNVLAANQRDLSDTSFDASPLAVAVHSFMKASYANTSWAGSATELLTALIPHVPDSIRNNTILWPKTPNGLSSQLARIAPLLREKGYTIERRHSGTRLIVIAPPQLAS